MSESLLLRRVLVGSTAAIAAAGLLAGCSQTAQPPQQNTSNHASTDSDDDQNLANTAADRGAVFDALNAAQQKFPNGKIVAAEWDDHIHGFEITLVDAQTKHELDVDSSAKIVSEKSERDDKAATKAQGMKTSLADALKDAMKQKQGFVFDEADLDEHNGALTWEITLINLKNAKEQTTLKLNA